LDQTAVPSHEPAELPSKYRFVRLIAESPMSSVYLAEETDLGRQVVLKMLNRRYAQEPTFRERFKREAMTAAQLDHPNIVPVYASGELDGRLYLVMRHVRGGDLGRLLASGAAADLQCTTKIVKQIAAALDAAHGIGLVHRDVKPGNILVDDQSGHAYLADFGIVKTASTESVTAAGGFLGTAAYAAPEQIEGGRVDRRTDVYALGCVAYHCLTGRKPFGSADMSAVLWGHLKTPPPRVSEQRPDLDGRVDAIVAKAMAKRPEDRYATCGEFAEALANRRPVLSTRPSRRTLPRPSRKWLAVSAATALVAVAAAAGVSLLPDGSASNGASSSSSPSAGAQPSSPSASGAFSAPVANGPASSSPTRPASPSGAGQSRRPGKSSAPKAVPGHTVKIDDRPGPSPVRGTWEPISAAPTNARKVCSQHDSHGSRLCVSTGPRLPTSVWFENRSPISFPVEIGVRSEDWGLRWGSRTDSQSGATTGVSWTGFANDCFWGLVYFPDGRWGARTHAHVCVS
jgi:serine/threonine protein kinase